MASTCMQSRPINGASDHSIAWRLIIFAITIRILILIPITTLLRFMWPARYVGHKVVLPARFFRNPDANE